ncbi:putative RNA helicase [Helianthus annuus]|uniref:RNA helicase n=1 Tax=Helianthus annuus TaxID=4232 RepID=A0A9K3DGP7_HELAN|nr:putative RNA helicase [Helianthus annuus]
MFSNSCKRDKLLHILALLKLDAVQKKVLVFTNTIDTNLDLNYFLNMYFDPFLCILPILRQNTFYLQFGIKSAVLNAELPVNSRQHILEVINFDMPVSAAGYVHQIGRTARAYNTGQFVSTISRF